VVDDDGGAVDAEGADERDPAGVPRRHRAAAQRGRVEAEVRLLVDRLPAVDVRAPIGEAESGAEFGRRRRRLPKRCGALSRRISRTRFSVAVRRSR
jgi:hypothetical protein